MSIKTIFICDKCKCEQLTDDQFWHVSVKAGTAKYGLYTVAKMEIQVCRPCLESYGIHVTQVKPPAVQPEVPTLESVITDIVQRAMEEVGT